MWKAKKDGSYKRHLGQRKLVVHPPGISLEWHWSVEHHDGRSLSGYMADRDQAMHEAENAIAN